MNEKRIHYDPAFFGKLVRLEDRHFWFRARNRVIRSQLALIGRGLPPNARVLEAGCGTGNTLRELERMDGLSLRVGLDAHGDGLRFARTRTACSLIQADMRNPPFREAFDLVCLFDILEHIPDDAGTLGSAARTLRPGGRLFLTVPARRALWGDFDRVAGHCRRYEEPELRAKLEAAALEVERITFFMTTLFLPLWIVRRLLPSPGGGEDGATGDDHAAVMRELKIIPLLNGVISALMRWEAVYLSSGKRGLPFGTSLLAVAHRGKRG